LTFAISYEDGVTVVVPYRASASPEELALGAKDWKSLQENKDKY